MTLMKLIWLTLTKMFSMSKPSLLMKQLKLLLRLQKTRPTMKLLKLKTLLTSLMRSHLLLLRKKQRMLMMVNTTILSQKKSLMH